MLPRHDGSLTKIALVIFFLIVLAYAYFEARGILYGPRITVTSEIQEVREPFVVVTGHADRIAELKMNGEVVTVTEDGQFEEPYVLSPGLNRIILDASDKYGRKRQEVIQIVYTPEPGAALPGAATSTPQTPSSSATTTGASSTKTEL